MRSMFDRDADASSNLVSCSTQRNLVARSVAGFLCVLSFESVLFWSLALKSMPTEGGAASDQRVASMNACPSGKCESPVRI
jgi:hypothetical protein